MPHSPQWHILDNEFATADAGLRPPARRIADGARRLAIANLDRADPPGYTPGGVPRLADFNANLFRITPEPRMPLIRVACAADGFDPSVHPIQWRLVCRHVLCRHVDVGGFRYRAASETFELEWRGESRAPDFTVFGPDCTYTYNDDRRVLGGHGLLMVATRIGATTLCDYVHLRVSGTNPTQADVFAYLYDALAAHDANVMHMARAIFERDSAINQFASQPQRAAAMTFTRRHHPEATQPECRVRFDWPDDPPGFPVASFDFGIGLSQFRRTNGQRICADLVWDWRENVRLVTNQFLKKLARKTVAGMTWQHLALAAWASHHGGGDAADRYARHLLLSDEGARISLATMPAAPRVASLDSATPLAPPACWLV